MKHLRGITLSFVSICSLFAGRAQAVVLLTENAENGLANVATNVSGYPLIQTDVAAQGTSAFHLANPGFADNFFRLTQPVTLAADSKLFFQSRLGFATAQQVARVQASTDGANWNIGLFNQAGTGGAGEGGFNLKTIDLSTYANQTLQFRFYYDHTGGSAFTQTSTDVGWLVDDIQIADQFQKSLYSIGNPSGEAQQYLEYINRARANALTEATRLANENDPQILSAYNSFGINGAAIINSFTNSVNSGQIDNVAQPLSFNAALTEAAELHTQDLFNNEFQGHNSSSNPPAPFQPGFSLGQRVTETGYSYQSLGENVFSYAESVRYGHAGFDVDWGGGGFQNPPGHRISIHNDDFSEVGIGVINGTNGSVGPQLVTQDFGSPGDVTFVTGVVYQDLNANSFYDLGEGRGGVRIDVDGSAFYAVSSDSGGYSVPVSGDGLKNVNFTGGGFAPFSTTAAVVGGSNVKVDYLAVMAPVFAADFDGDSRVNGIDFNQWRGDFGETTGGGSDADDDGDSDGADFLVWQQEFGSGGASAAVPEPAAATSLLIPLAMWVARFRRARRTLE